MKDKIRKEELGSQMKMNKFMKYNKGKEEKDSQKKKSYKDMMKRTDESFYKQTIYLKLNRFLYKKYEYFKRSNFTSNQIEVTTACDESVDFKEE